MRETAPEVPRQQAPQDRSAGSSTPQADGPNFDYTESLKEAKATFKDFVNSDTVQGVWGTVKDLAQNKEVQDMLLGFALGNGHDSAAGAEGTAGGASAEGTGEGAKPGASGGNSVEKIKIDRGNAPSHVTAAYKPTFDAFSQIDPNRGDGGLSQAELLQMGSDQRLDSHAQIMAEAWGKKENFDRLAAFDGDASTISAEDINQVTQSRNLDLIAEIGKKAEKDIKAADDREKVGLPRDASQEAYLNELERRGLSNFADTIAQAAIENENDETGGFGPVKKMADALAAAAAAGISLQELAKVVNSKLAPGLGAEMTVHEDKNGIRGEIGLPLNQGVSFSFRPDGTVDYLRTINGEWLGG